MDLKKFGQQTFKAIVFLTLLPMIVSVLWFVAKVSPKNTNVPVIECHATHERTIDVNAKGRFGPKITYASGDSVDVYMICSKFERKQQEIGIPPKAESLLPNPGVQQPPTK